MIVNIYQCLENGFPRDRNQTCIEVPGKRAYTWADLDAGVARIANLFSSLKLEKGARVAVQVGKSVDALMVYLATVRAGFVYLPLNTAYRETEISYFLEDADPAVVICTPENLVSVTAASVRVGSVHVFTLGDANSGSLLDAAASHPPDFVTVPLKPDDMASIVYTMGKVQKNILRKIYGSV